jgi:hypothetical protein
MNPDGSPSCSAVPPTLFETEYGVYLTGGYITNLSGTLGSASGSPCTGPAIGTGEVDSTLTTDQGSIGISFDTSRVTNVSSIIFSGVTVLQGDGNGNYTVPAIQITGTPTGLVVSGNTITAPPGGSITSAIISAVPIAGYRDIPVISIHEIIIQEGQAFDLQVGSPQVSQTNAVVGSDGNLAVSPNTPIQINVPVSGSGFNNPELRSTTITLKAGSQPLQSQTISLAAIQSAGTLIVPFTVTFDPSFAGTTQTITATIDPGNALNESNFSNNTASVQVDVAGPVNLSISNISLSQPVGTAVPVDSDGNPIIATVTPPDANPAPVGTPTPVEAQVTVNMTGTPSGVTSTDVQLMLGDQVIADQTIDISQFQQGDNTVKIDFTPPTDPDLLGVLTLTATINASKAVQESNYTNDSFKVDVDTMVLCKVADAGRVVPFYGQSSAPWGSQPFGIPPFRLVHFKIMDVQSQI